MRTAAALACAELKLAVGGSLPVNGRPFEFCAPELLF
jgi:hypothetical protein